MSCMCFVHMVGMGPISLHVTVRNTQRVRVTLHVTNIGLNDAVWVHLPFCYIKKG